MYMNEAIEVKVPEKNPDKPHCEWSKSNFNKKKVFFIKTWSKSNIESYEVFINSKLTNIKMENTNNFSSLDK